MGQVLSFITEIIKTAVKLRFEVKQDELDEEKRKIEKIKAPIEPPKFYKSIEERKAVIKDQAKPYSVVSIKDSLKNDTIPVGYSLEQLAKVGFNDSVSEFTKRRNERLAGLKKEFTSTVGKIEDEINKGFGDLSTDDRALFEKMGVFDDSGKTQVLSKLDTWKKQVDTDTVSTVMIDEIIDLMKGRVDLIQDVFASGEFDKKIQEQIEDSQRKKTSQALMLVRRALKVV